MSMQQCEIAAKQLPDLALGEAVVRLLGAVPPGSPDRAQLRDLIIVCAREGRRFVFQVAHEGIRHLFGGHAARTQEHRTALLVAAVLSRDPDILHEVRRLGLDANVDLWTLQSAGVGMPGEIVEQAYEMACECFGEQLPPPLTPERMGRCVRRYGQLADQYEDDLADKHCGADEGCTNFNPNPLHSMPEAVNEWTERKLIEVPLWREDWDCLVRVIDQLLTVRKCTAAEQGSRMLPRECNAYRTRLIFLAIADAIGHCAKRILARLLRIVASHVELLGVVVRAIVDADRPAMLPLVEEVLGIVVDRELVLAAAISHRAQDCISEWARGAGKHILRLCVEGSLFSAAVVLMEPPATVVHVACEAADGPTVAILEEHDVAIARQPHPYKADLRVWEICDMAHLLQLMLTTPVSFHSIRLLWDGGFVQTEAPVLCSYLSSRGYVKEGPSEGPDVWMWRGSKRVGSDKVGFKRARGE